MLDVIMHIHESGNQEAKLGYIDSEILSQANKMTANGRMVMVTVVGYIKTIRR